MPALWVSSMEDPLNCLSNKGTVKGYGSGAGESQQILGQIQALLCDLSGILT